MSATAGLDHHPIDGAEGTELMQASKSLGETPLGLVA